MKRPLMIGQDANPQLTEIIVKITMAATVGVTTMSASQRVAKEKIITVKTPATNAVSQTMTKLSAKMAVKASKNLATQIIEIPRTKKSAAALAAKISVAGTTAAMMLQSSIKNQRQKNSPSLSSPYLRKSANLRKRRWLKAKDSPKGTVQRHLVRVRANLFAAKLLMNK